MNKTLIKKKIKERTKINQNGCWEWILVSLPNGYAHLNLGHLQIVAHRASYLAYKGKIPKGMVVDHTCSNRKCVNPAHLDCVSQKENVQRSYARLKTRHIDRIFCTKGHKLTEDNILNIKEVKANGKTYFYRRCLICSHKRDRIQTLRKRINGEKTHP